jgi:hypothetical protein
VTSISNQADVLGRHPPEEHRIRGLSLLADRVELAVSARGKSEFWGSPREPCSSRGRTRPVRVRGLKTGGRQIDAVADHKRYSRGIVPSRPRVAS